MTAQMRPGTTTFGVSLPVSTACLSTQNPPLVDKFQPVLAATQEPADPEVDAIVRTLDEATDALAYHLMALAFERFGFLSRGPKFATGLDLVDAGEVGHGR